MNDNQAEERDLINIPMLAKRLGVSPKTIYAWVHMRKIPYLKIGRLVKFQSRDIQNWVERNKVNSVESR